MDLYRPTAHPLPQDSRLRPMFVGADLADCYAIGLPAGVDGDPERLARALFAGQAGWARSLLKLRDLLVRPFGLKTSDRMAAAGDRDDPDNRRIGIFRIYEIRPDEIILGEDDCHLDFRLTVRLAPDPDRPGERLVMTATAVRCHNGLGRLYIALIRPFHVAVVRSGLARAARAGWRG